MALRMKGRGGLVASRCARRSWRRGGVFASSAAPEPRSPGVDEKKDSSKYPYTEAAERLAGAAARSRARAGAGAEALHAAADRLMEVYDDFAGSAAAVESPLGALAVGAVVLQYETGWPQSFVHYCEVASEDAADIAGVQEESGVECGSEWATAEMQFVDCAPERWELLPVGVPPNSGSTLAECPRVAVLPTTSAVQFCLTDGEDQWDNKDACPFANYSVPGPGHWVVRGGRVAAFPGPPSEPASSLE